MYYREELLRLRNSKPTAGAHLNVPAQTPSLGVSDALASPGEPASEDTIPKDQTDRPPAVSEGEDDDSEKSTGHQEAADNDQDMMLDADDDMETASDVAGPPRTAAAGPSLIGPPVPETMTEMIQRLLKLNPNVESGQLVLQPGGQLSSGEPPNADNNSDTSDPSEFCASIMRNGRPICNLPDHAIHAGATAVVAVILGSQLTVANAGDSRAILCRSGVAYPLTADHKPLQDRELTRIRNAGGFVNHFGRVNGNLNLSRSIGDLKYKQVPGLAPAEQMITAEPDIVQ